MNLEIKSLWEECKKLKITLAELSELSADAGLNGGKGYSRHHINMVLSAQKRKNDDIVEFALKIYELTKEENETREKELSARIKRAINQ